jgi:hypothetical protein
MRAAGGGGQATIDRLADLANDDEVIDLSDAQRPEYLLPRWR